MTAAESKKRKVLIVSHSFPPANTSGAVRVGKLAKYLPKFGWEPIVLTVDKWRGYPQTLPVEIDETKVIRTPYFDLSPTMRRKLVDEEVNSRRILSQNEGWRKTASKLLGLATFIYGLPIFRAVLPNPVGWYGNAIKAGRQIVKEHKFDVIFSSYYPSSSHFVASHLQKESGIPWVAEFRDLWSLNPYHTTTRISSFFEQKIERRGMRNSSLLVAISEHDAHKLQEMHSKKTAVITNGFDEEDYLEDVPLTSKFTITYTGNIYSGKRTPILLFEALKQLQQEGKIPPDSLEVRFFGINVTGTISPLIKEYCLQELVKIYDFVPFKESIVRQKESTALLLLSWNDPRDKGTYTAKIFEYLGAQRPILATAYKTGAIDRLLQETGAGIIANEAKAIKDVLSCWLEEWQQSRKIISHWNPDGDMVKKYTRREGARKLAQVLEEASA